MGIEETAEAWIRVEVFCDGLGDDGICPRGAGDELERIFDTAPTAPRGTKSYPQCGRKSGLARPRPKMATLVMS